MPCCPLGQLATPSAGPHKYESLIYRARWLKRMKRRNEKERAASRALVPHLYFITGLQPLSMSGDTVAAAVRAAYWIQRLEYVLRRDGVFQTKVVKSRGVARNGKVWNVMHLKWNEKVPRNEIWHAGCWGLESSKSLVTTPCSAPCVCVCVRVWWRESEHCASTGWVCNVMQAAFAPVTSSSTLLFRPDGD